MTLVLVLGVLGAAAGQDDDATPTERAIVLRFEGWRAQMARRDVVRAISDHVVVVAESDAVRAAGELGVDVSTPEGMADVVRSLDIRYVVTGAVDGRGRRATVRLTVLDAEAGELSFREGGSPRNRTGRRELRGLAVEAILEAQSVLAYRREEAIREQIAAEEAEEERRRAESLTARMDEERAAAAAAEAAAGNWRQPTVTVLAGVRLRTAQTTVALPTDVSIFEASLFPTIALDTEIRPLATSEDPMLRGLQFGLEGEVSVGVSYVTNESPPQERTMTALRLRADAGYGYVFEDLVEIRGLLGYTLDGVQLDGQRGFPSTLLSALRLAAGMRVRVYESMVMVDAELGGRLGLDTGDLGPAIGGADIFGGVDGEVSLLGVIDPGFTYAIRGSVRWYTIPMSGGLGTFGQGQSAEDLAFGIRALVGWAFQ